MDILAGVVMVVLVVAGALINSAFQPVSVTLGTNTSDGACDSLCAQWDARRQERCNAQAAERTAQASVSSLTGAVAAAAVIAAGLWIAARFFPVLTIAALVATAAVELLVGALVSALVIQAAKSNATATALNNEAQARALLLANCKDPAKVSACLALPSPC